MPNGITNGQPLQDEVAAAIAADKAHAEAGGWLLIGETAGCRGTAVAPLTMRPKRAWAIDPWADARCRRRTAA